MSFLFNYTDVLFYFIRCLDYSGIGYVIGHELVHGFDNKGNYFEIFENLFVTNSKNVNSKFM